VLLLVLLLPHRPPRGSRQLVRPVARGGACQLRQVMAKSQLAVQSQRLVRAQPLWLWACHAQREKQRPSRQLLLPQDLRPRPGKLEPQQRLGSVAEFVSGFQL
jgi:hypothetical protein